MRTRLVFALLLTTLWTVISLSGEKQPAGTSQFRMTAGDKRLSAVEEYRIEKREAGYYLLGNTLIQQGDTSVELVYEQTFSADWSSESYKLTRKQGAGERVFTLLCDRTRAYLRAWAGQDVRERTEAGDPGMIILDNAVVAHIQILLHRFAARGGARNWIVAAPQVFLFTPGTMAKEGREPAILDGRPIETQKYALESAGLRMEIWAEAATNRLMRLAVPIQSMETLREGFLPAPPMPKTKEPVFLEKEIKFASSVLEIPATLCLPKGDSAGRAAVVLVHGSGPSDRDETIGPNKPLRDLSHGLAAHGIASLRYDKRTFAFARQIDPNRITLDEEVIQDALSAVEMLRRQSGIDPNGIFLIGHSLGAMLAPTIASRSAAIQGIVMLGPGARPFDEIVISQMESQSRLAGGKEEEIRKQIESMRQYFARLRAGQIQDSDALMATPASYWRELLALDVPASLTLTKVPVFVLNGGKDVQVGRNDHDRILEVLRQRDRALDKSAWLPEHNHLFMKFDGNATVASYGRAGRVDPAVIDSIASWIRLCIQRLQGGGAANEATKNELLPEPWSGKRG